MKKDCYYEIEDYKIPRLPRLTKEEEKELIIRYKNGDMEAGKKVIEHNYWLIISICKDFYINESVSELDMFQEGCIGAMRALNRFKTDYNYRFSTYAYSSIKDRITKYINKNSQSFGINVNYVSLINRIKRYEDLLVLKLQREPTIEELSKELGISATVLKDLKICFYKSISFEEELYLKDEQHYVNLYEYISYDEDSLEDRISKRVDDKIDMDLIFDIINSWDVENERDRKIFLDYYFSEYSVTLKDLAQKYNLSVERIRQISSGFMVQLRSDLNRRMSSEQKKYFLKN